MYNMNKIKHKDQTMCFHFNAKYIYVVQTFPWNDVEIDR
jgi:hypothetical protein